MVTFILNIKVRLYMTLKRINKLMITCGILYCSSSMVYASEIYGVLELGNAISRFDDAKVSVPTNSTVSSAVVDDTDNSPFAAIGVGYDWDGKPLRAEIVYRKSGSQEFVEDTVFTRSLKERTTVKVKEESLMFNLLYDINIDNSNLTPYIGAGVGGSKTKISAIQKDYPLTARSASFSENSDVNFAWNLVVGVDYDITEKIIMGLGYRYTDAGKVSTDDNCVGSDAAICDANETHSADLKIHSLFFNVNYYF